MRKAIFITGGGSGIGRATAQLFAGKGWFVGLGDVNAAGMHETAAMLPEEQSSLHVMDVRNPSDWETALDDFAESSDGRLDVLFSNAGIAVGGPLADTRPQDIERVIDINLKGVFWGAQAGFAMLKNTPGSVLVNTCSAAGLYAGPGMAAYSATKFGVRALTEALDQEWAEHDIKVRSIMPGFIDTPLLDALSAGSNRAMRETVRDVGLEFTPVKQVAEAVWAVAHEGAVHRVVGKTARRIKFLSRWAPGLLHRRGKKRTGAF